MSKSLKSYGAVLCFLFLFAALPLAGISQRRHELPEATLNATPEEAKWWDDLRAAAASAARRSSGRKEREKYVRLLQEGVGKSYRVPIEDKGPTYIRMAEPEYTEEARRMRVSGRVMLRVEMRADGTVGEVIVTRGLGFGLDEKAEEAARRLVFLPAVEDRKFQTAHKIMEMSFDIY